ncbi:MAG: L-seryl-tRNA(Sec) selenium transferase [Deltaproteobacteria bacterium]|nr:L-seryl-tRNA(Sec) selenium transferase [Deltaproteobacteria bacterium]MBW2069956.1 L-seryl-tRNA(Sec) selenium transferase [Deltaproteobacteria bacterium]
MNDVSVQELLRSLPAVDELLRHQQIEKLLQQQPRSLVVMVVRQVLSRYRSEILEGVSTSKRAVPEIEQLVQNVIRDTEKRAAFTLRSLVNGTGIIVHTNLGRSLLCEAALERLQLIGSHYTNLEYDLEAGARGSRYVHAEEILCEITGAEGALVVNNNAGAVLLVLNTLAQGLEVIVSRGELVEIGGAFRIPDVMAKSGARLHEVGCTNRTHLHDYERSIGPETGLLLKAHTSNYQIVGFTASVDLQSLVGLGRKHGLPVMEDLGSGCFVDLSRFGLQGEPTVQDSVATGVDVVTFSGDKLLGGPQAGIILARKDIIARLRQNPLTRALRIDKLTLAALEATLRLYRDEETAVRSIPTLKMIAADEEELQRRAAAVVAQIRAAAGSTLEAEIIAGFSKVGGGALPVQTLPSKLVALHSRKFSASQLEKLFRRHQPPVIGRIEQDIFVLDVRTLQSGDEDIIAAAASLQAS